MKTPAEVLRGLDTCANNQPCKGCPYDTPGFSNYPSCMAQMMKDAADIIKKQGAVQDGPAA